MLSALPPQPIPLCAALLAVVAASIDLASRRIPNRLIALGLVGALVAQCALPGPHTGFVAWLAGAATGAGLLLPFYVVRGMAAGDVKLMLAIGAWVGPTLALHIALATFVVGGAWALAVVAKRRRLRKLLANLRHLFAGAALLRDPSAARAAPGIDSVGTLPYGVAIAIGTLGVLFAAAA
ncbi:MULTISPECIES: prepilin peptidase [unclassified Burkholderia]|uniref:A24 family peptidase n=1 Tax=unclassified Burkholderia TaxID=2613784 RepID=UPI00075387F7|nr:MULTISPECIES: prepilin peptidase [unclassified Burkholderia]KVN03155.1 peptidase A24 [Burkholderia sp. MSMB1552]KWZ49814.1 peptidase A24 [Burkholderia sp. MSMB1588]